MKWAAAHLACKSLAFFTFILSPAFAGLKICDLDLGLAPQALCFRLLCRL